MKYPRTRWLSATLDLLLSACLRCRTLVDTNVLLCICTSLLCAGPITGCSSVHAVRRYCRYRSLDCAFAVCAEEAGSKTKDKKKKKGKRGIKRTV